MTNEAPRMSPQDFYAFVDAYGADESRWPREKRAVAARSASTPEGAAYLEKAARLDALLSRYQAPSPSPELMARVLPPQAFAAAGRRATLQKRLRAWWMGAGLVGLGLAGGLTGAIAVSVILPGQPMPFADGVMTIGMNGSVETAFGIVSSETMPGDAGPGDNDVTSGTMR